MNDFDRVVEAVQKFKSMLLEEVDSVDISNVNYEELRSAILDEQETGQTGSFLDILVDLNDSVGLEDFGFIIK